MAGREVTTTLALKLSDKATAPMQAAMNRLNKTTNMMSGSMMKLTNIVRTMWVAYAGYKIVEKFTAVLTKGFHAVEDYRQKLINLSAFMTTFSKRAQEGDITGAYKEASAYAAQLIVHVERLDAQTIATGRDLSLMAETMIKNRVLLDTQNEAQAEGFVRIANALIAVTAGQNKELQIQQEINALLSGRVRTQDRLGKMLMSIDPQLKEHLNLWKQQGTIIEEVGKLLVGFDPAAKDLEHTWEAIKTTMSTIVDQVLRGGFVPVYEDIIGYAETLKYKYRDQNGQLTEQAKILQGRIQKTWLIIKNIIFSIGQLLKPFSPYLKGLGDLTLRVADGWSMIAAIVSPLAERIGSLLKSIVTMGGVFYDFIQAAWSAASLDWESAAWWAKKSKRDWIKAGAEAGDALKGGLIKEMKSGFDEYRAIAKNVGKVVKTNISPPEMADSLNNVGDAAEKVGNHIDKVLNAAIAKLIRLMDKAKTAMDRITLMALPEYERGLESIHREYEQANKDLDKYGKLNGKTVAEIAQLHKDLGLRMNEDLAEYVRSHDKAAKKVTEAWINTYNKLTDTLGDWIATGKFDLKNFFDWIKHALAQLAATKIIGSAAMALGLPGAASWAGGGSVGTTISAGMTSALGMGSTGQTAAQAAMAAGYGPVTEEWAISQGFKNTVQGGSTLASLFGGGKLAALGKASGIAFAGYFAGGLVFGREKFNKAMKWLAYGWMKDIPVLGKLFGGIFGGNIKRGYLGQKYEYTQYNPESGWGTGEMVDQWREDRNGDDWIESADEMAEAGLELMNAMDSTFKELLEIFGGEEYVTRFTTAMGKLAMGENPEAETYAGQAPLGTHGLAFSYYISAENEDEFKEDWLRSWKRMTQGLIDPIVDVGTNLLREALDETISDSSIWNYFTDDFKTYIEDNLEKSLGDLKIDWSQVTDEESLKKALETMGMAAENIAAIVEHFDAIGKIFASISDAIEMHGLSGSAQNAIHSFRGINAEFATFAATLKAKGVDLEKYTDLEKAHQLALQDVAYAMAQAGISGEDFTIALQHVADEMLKAGKTAEDVATMQASVAEGVVRSIGDSIDAIYNSLMMEGMSPYEAALYNINQRYKVYAEQLEAVNKLYDKQGNLTDVATRAISAYNLEIQRLANTILNTIRDTQRQLATMGMESGQASLLAIGARYGQAPSALQLHGQEFLSWYAQADPAEIATALADWGVSIDQFNADMIALGNSLMNQSDTQHREAQATRNEMINSLDSAISGIDSMLADLGPTGKYAPVQSAAGFQNEYEKLLDQIKTSEDPAKYVKQLQSFLPNYMSFMGAYGGDYKDVVASVQGDLEGLNVELKSEWDYLKEIAGSSGSTAANTADTTALLNLGIPISFNTTGLDSAAVAFLQGLQEIVSLVGWNSPFTIDFVSNYTGFTTMPFDDFVNTLIQVAEIVPGGAHSTITIDMIMNFENWDDATIEEKIASWNAIKDTYGWHSPVTFEFMADMVDTGTVTWADWKAYMPTDPVIRKELLIYLNNNTGLGVDDLSNIFGQDTVANMHIGADLIWGEGSGHLDVVVGNAVTLAKFGNINADDWTNGIAIGVIAMWEELVAIHKNTAALNAGVGFPAYFSGGLTYGPSLAGEGGREWVVPTYEPQRSSFLRDVGADPEAIGAAVAKHLMPMSQTSRDGGIQEVHVHIEIDGQEIRNPVIVGLQGRDTELIGTVRRAVR